MHNTLEILIDNNSFLKSMIEKDKIKLRKPYVSYKKSIILLFKILEHVANALFIRNIIRKC